jgi:hypothetical protein
MESRKRGHAVAYVRRSTSMQSSDLHGQCAWAIAEANRLFPLFDVSLVELVQPREQSQNRPNDTPGDAAKPYNCQS